MELRGKSTLISYIAIFLLVAIGALSLWYSSGFFPPLRQVKESPNERSLPSEHIRFATGPEGGTYRVLGDTIKQVLEKSLQGLQLDLLASSGSIENMALLVNGTADFALVQSDVIADAPSGSHGSTSQPLLWHSVVVLSEEPVQVVLGPDTAESTLQALNQRPLILGIANSGTLFTSTQMLAALKMNASPGISVDSNDELIAEMRGRKAHAAFFVNQPPAQTISYFLADPKYRLLSFQTEDIEMLQSASPVYRSYTINPNTYPHQPDYINTVSLQTILVCRSTIPEDLVRRVFLALVSDVGSPISSLRQAQNAVDLAGMLKPLDERIVSLHPGARQAMQQIPWRVRLIASLRWLQWLTLIILTICGMYVSIYRVLRLRIAYAIINRMPRFTRSTVKIVLFNDMVWRIFRAGCLLALLWLIGAAIMFYIERSNNVNFSTMRSASLSILLYIFSGAEGRIPVTTTGWMVFVVMLVAGILVGAYITGEFASEIMRHTFGGVKMDKKLAKESILVIGWSSHSETLIEDFFNAFSDGMPECGITVFTEQSIEANRIHEYTKKGVTFLSGNCLEKSILDRIDAQSSRSIIIMADESAKDPDAKTALVALELRSLFRKKHLADDARPRICAEVLDSTRIDLVRDAGADAIVCHQNFGLALLAQAAFSDKLLDVYQTLVGCNRNNCEIYLLSSTHNGHSDIPSTTWKNRFHGRTFHEASSEIHGMSEARNPMILMGIRRGNQVLLAPKDHVQLEDGDDLIILAWKLPRID